MRATVRRAWGWCAAGGVVATGVFAGYLAVRPMLPTWGPSWLEPTLFMGLLVAGVASLASSLTREHYRRTLRGLSDHVRSLRDNANPRTIVALDPDLDLLYAHLEAFATSYRHALAEVVDRNEELERAEMMLNRTDSVRGQVHSFIISKKAALATNATGNMIARLTPNHFWVGATPTMQQFLGRPLSALNGRSFMEVVHPDDVPALTRVFRDALEVGEAHNISFRVQTDAKGERHLQMDLLTRYNETGAPVHLRCHFIDITDRVRTDRELRRRTEELSRANERLRQINQDLQRLKETYRDLYNQTPVMYFGLDVRGHFAACNDTLIRTLGYERTELFGQSYTRLLTSDGQQRFEHTMAAYQRNGEIETQWVKKDGTVIDVLIRNTIIEDEGRFFRSRAAAQDMTERKRLGDALRANAVELTQANTQLRRINRELDDFTYVVSHDLKEPLRTIEAFSNFLAQDYGEQLGADGHDYISHLIQASRRLRALIDDLLMLSRAGRSTGSPRVFDLTDAVQTARSDLADLIQRKEARLRVEGILPAVVGDQDRVMQLLTNLISNGLKYNTAAQPEVTIGAADSANGTPSGHVTLFVRDNGIGIAPEYHEQVFGIFRRLHRREDYEGTGAGLAICKKIVEAHGGRIWIESTPGNGATFFFTLPRPTTVPSEDRVEGEPNRSTEDVAHAVGAPAD
jgi:PAS domain S-box-containing protein